MINLLISLAAAAAVFLAFFSGAHMAPATSLLPAIIVAGVAYFLLARRTLKQMEAILLAGQTEIAAARTPQGTVDERRVNAALNKIKEAFALGRWQFLIAPQVHAALGSYLYVFKRFDEAEPHLAKSFVRFGQAHAMLGALYFQRKDYEKMKKVFDNAVTHNKKDGFIWSLYAYCLDKAGERPQALEVLSRAVKENPDDEKLKTNQAALQNNERIRMKAYGQMWWAFHLEPPPIDVPPQMRGQLQQRKGYRTPPQR